MNNYSVGWLLSTWTTCPAQIENTQDSFLQVALTWILLMCALRAHNSKPILEKVYRELKKF